MKVNNFDVIIIGGSYSGLSAGMALGRALKKVLIIDRGHPCNKQTPYSHNFLTQDGSKPSEIAMLGKKQVLMYKNVSFFEGQAISGKKSINGFEVVLPSGETFFAKKLIFATGIKDVMPEIDGFAACWGISVLHCPYCHGYEMKNTKTGIFSNGNGAFDFAMLISNWTDDLTLFTNGPSMLTRDQTNLLDKRRIKVVEKQITELDHTNGNLQNIVFTDGTSISLQALYAQVQFVQHCQIPELLGCELTEEGYVRTDSGLQTTVEGVYACGDNATRMRTVSNAVAMGTTAGITVSKKMILEEFDHREKE